MLRRLLPRELGVKREKKRARSGISQAGVDQSRSIESEELTIIDPQQKKRRVYIELSDDY
jgi:hypothetical protein